MICMQPAKKKVTESAMARILVLYASFDGQTERIAQRVGTVLHAAGHGVAVRSADAPQAGGDIAEHDAVIVGGAIRYGRCARHLENLAREHAQALAARPNAFFTVSMSAGGPGARPATAQRQADEFCERTRWQPRETANFAGALRYRTYNPFIRFMMRLIVGMAGGDTDTSRDYEYTDWKAVDRFASAFAARLAVAAAA
jgi:menaquinone-dependent protoporphyrinogen oxidase